MENGDGGLAAQCVSRCSRDVSPSEGPPNILGRFKRLVPTAHNGRSGSRIKKLSATRIPARRELLVVPVTVEPDDRDGATSLDKCAPIDGQGIVGVTARRPANGTTAALR